MLNNDVAVNTNQSNKIIFLAMLYVVCKITCDPLFFRQIMVPSPFSSSMIKITGSAIIYPLTYICCDLLSTALSRKQMLQIIVLGALGDGVFSFFIHSIARFPIPKQMSVSEFGYMNAINLVAPRMWSLYYHGVIASIVATLAEVILFIILFKRIKHLTIAMMLSVTTVLVLHNLISNYPVLRNEADGLSVVLHSSMFELVFAFIYIGVASFFRSNYFYSSTTICAEFMLDIFKYLTSFRKDRINSKMDIVKKSIHNICSPLSIIDHIVSNIKKDNIVPAQNLDELQKALASVRYISTHLLDDVTVTTKKQSTQHINLRQTCYFQIKSIIQWALDAKKIEWRKNPCTILCNFVNVDDVWLYLIPYDLQTILSNLLNNAYEARLDDNSNIIMNVINIGSEVVITITNFGVVIPHNKITAVMAGTSLKKGGHGIGLSGAKEYVEEIGGTISLTSSKIEGTTVTLKLPKPLPPKWAFNEDTIDSSQNLIVCSTVASNHSHWQKYCSINGIDTMKYCTTLAMFNEYAVAHRDPNVLIFMHHDFTSTKSNALELLAANNIKYACLVTDQIEDISLQKAIGKTDYFLMSQESVQKMLKSAVW